MALTDLPRVPLGTFPTPLQHVADLAGMPGLRDVLVKRDDLTGFAWGGNKVRTLEFVLGDAVSLQADTIVVAGGPPSNFAALLAVAAAGQGIAVVQVCYGNPRDGAAALALSRRAGAAVEFTGSADRRSMDIHARELAGRLRAQGRRPYVVPRGGATPVGACGFAVAAAELVSQLAERRIGSASVVIPVGSGGSIAGLLAGLASTNGIEVVGVSVSRPVEEIEAQVATRAEECARLIGATGPLPRWRVVDGRGPGYGGGWPEADELAAALLQHSGFVADPVYNAKALLWLSSHRNELSGPVLYWSTGGALAAADELTTPAAAPTAVGEEVTS
ncbi:pyridoxal-phosphate dependent enzyme [Kribbella pittospori]|uniref:Pyridoxal-phosphate dependent enzyme n=1 Tax=Kribbella pittospori TaxID=722689 RepID=A0A4R0KND1_9ACTN|nr:pyridoxal-phosphate dependent enzyme [Kribbella pittospori]TCC62313.1 pyridoxal-phosphate dependent enzyme [Kribbella pittospori]